MGLPNYDRWKLATPETWEEEQEELRLEALVERYEEEYQAFLEDTFTRDEIQDLKEMGYINAI